MCGPRAGGAVSGYIEWFYSGVVFFRYNEYYIAVPGSITAMLHPPTPSPTAIAFCALEEA